MRKKSDGQLQHDVVAELEWDPSVDHADIGVAVNDGVVTLAGYVKSYPQKVAAERAVRRVAGVRALAEELKIRFASDPKTADHEIAKRIVDMIGWTVAIPDGQITGVSNRIKVGNVPAPADVKARIMAAFKRQAGLDASDVSVTTEGGTVMLRGRVKAWAERRMAELAA